MTAQAQGSRHGVKDGLFRRLLFAQESGLVLVILLAIALLAALGGDKESPQIAFIREAPGGPALKVEQTSDRLRLSLGDSVREFRYADGWTGREISPGAWRLQRFEVAPVPAGATITEVAEDGQSTILVQAGGAAARYPVERGWRIDTLPDGSSAVLRNPRINKFLDPQNLVLVGTSAAFFAIMAVGMTAIIAMNGIDLSIGSIYGIAAVAGAFVLAGMQERAGAEGVSGLVAIPVALLVCCGVGGLCGLVNGSLIVGLKVHPFIITLGMMAALRGVVFVMTRGNSISGLPPSFTSGFYKAELGGVYPVPLLVTLLVVALGSFVLARTVFGRRVYAIGGNETAARYAGIPVGRVKAMVFMIAGVLAGLSASASLGYYGAATPQGGQGYELQVIAASVIGGASLSGGRGTALGAVLGAILIQLIDNGMLILEIDQSYNQIVMGAAIIAAVVLDQTKQKFGGGRSH